MGWAEFIKPPDEPAPEDQQLTTDLAAGGPCGEGTKNRLFRWPTSGPAYFPGWINCHEAAGSRHGLEPIVVGRLALRSRCIGLLLGGRFRPRLIGRIGRGVRGPGLLLVLAARRATAPRRCCGRRHLASDPGLIGKKFLPAGGVVLLPQRERRRPWVPRVDVVALARLPGGEIGRAS